MSEIDPKYRETMNRVAAALDKGFGGMGFALLLFDMNEPVAGRMNWISNAERASMIVALKEMVAQLEGRAGKTGSA